MKPIENIKKKIEDILLIDQRISLNTLLLLQSKDSYSLLDTKTLNEVSLNSPFNVFVIDSEDNLEKQFRFEETSWLSNGWLIRYPKASLAAVLLEIHKLDSESNKLTTHYFPENSQKGVISPDRIKLAYIDKNSNILYIKNLIDNSDTLISENSKPPIEFSPDSKILHYSIDEKDQKNVYYHLEFQVFNKIRGYDSGFVNSNKVWNYSEDSIYETFDFAYEFSGKLGMNGPDRKQFVTKKRSPKFDNEGHHLALQEKGVLYLHNLTNPISLSGDPSKNINFSWSPDNKIIAYEHWSIDKPRNFPDIYTVDMNKKNNLLIRNRKNPQFEPPKKW